MRIDLTDLLKRRTISHPSRLKSIRSNCDGSIVIELAGFPWWLDTAAVADEGRIQFRFEGIIDGVFYPTLFRADDGSEDLEVFTVRPLSECGWATDPHCDVFCNSPVPDPTNVFSALDAFLKQQNCPFPAMRYLNPLNGTLRDFIALAASRSFSICSGPLGIAGSVCAVLSAQGVEYSLLRGPDVSLGLLWVEIGASQFACQQAYAVFET